MLLMYSLKCGQSPSCQPLEENQVLPTSLPEAMNSKELHFNILITIFELFWVDFCLGCYYLGVGGRWAWWWSEMSQKPSICLFLTSESAVINTMAKTAFLPFIGLTHGFWSQHGPWTATRSLVAGSTCPGPQLNGEESRHMQPRRKVETMNSLCFGARIKICFLLIV